jgi:hypothetical protein
MRYCEICKMVFNKFMPVVAHIFIKSIIVPDVASLNVQAGKKLEFNRRVLVCTKHNHSKPKRIKKQTIFSSVWQSLRSKICY